jgi:hypothetical protein
MTQPPFVIIAAGVCPQNLSPGQRAPNTTLCTVIRGLTGQWTATVDDLSVDPGECVLILSPGGGSNVAGGVSFGQSQQSGRTFAFESYRNVGAGEDPPGQPFDIEIGFIVVKYLFPSS